MLNFKKEQIYLWILLFLFLRAGTAEAYDSQYAKAVHELDNRVQREKRGYAYERANNFEEAINVFQGIVRDCGNSISSSSSRNALIRLYERTGQYEKALQQVKWFLNGNQNEQGRQALLADQQRLLQKIEAQKRGGQVEEQKPSSESPDSIKTLMNFETASYSDQKQYMEEKLPENNLALKLSKQAMLAEHEGNFKDAKGYYEQLLTMKEQVISAHGEAAWPMLYCAVQRNSEVTGDEITEKEMLVWIRGNLLLENGTYHRYLYGLLPSIRSHLEVRIEHYGLNDSE